MGRRAQAEQVENHRFAVALPAVAEKAALRLPAMGHRDAAALRPVPIRAQIERVGELSDFVLLLVFAGEVGCGGQHAGNENGAVDRGQFALPNPPSALHV